MVQLLSSGRTAVLGAVCMPIFLLPSRSFAAATTTYTLTGTTTWVKRALADVKTCTADYKCTTTNAQQAQQHELMLATQLPMAWTLDGFEVQDLNGDPLVIDGVKIVATPVDCGNACLVEALHPAPDGSIWYQFATNPLPSVDGSGEIDFRVVLTTTDDGTNPVGQPVASWVTNNGADLYGDDVTEAFGSGLFFFTLCPTDLNADDAVDGADLGLFLGNWGATGVTDFNADGNTDGADLGVLLAAWGSCPS